jgi:HAMP domain-containing protein
MMLQALEAVLLISGLLLLGSWLWVIGCSIQRARAFNRMDKFDWRRRVEQLRTGFGPNHP